MWRYLDEIGYFVDESKRAQILDQRLADLGTETYETIVADLAAYLAQTIGDSPVSDLDDDLRQGLREALEALGFFESAGLQEQVLSQPLGGFRREALDDLAVILGQTQLALRDDRALCDLSPAEQEGVISHLKAHDWFLDQGRFAQQQTQPLRNLEPGIRRDLVQTIRHQQREQLRGQRLSSLERDQRHMIHTILLEEGLALDERDMRPFQRKKVKELDEVVYDSLLRHLAAKAIESWGTTCFQDLSAEQQDLLSAYLGRRIMAHIERRILLYTISRLWIDYLTDIEDLRRGIGLEAYGQRDPLVEYKRRAFELFEELGHNIRRTTVRSLFRQPPEPLDAPIPGA